jgi:hypothetical protein
MEPGGGCRGSASSSSAAATGGGGGGEVERRHSFRASSTLLALISTCARTRSEHIRLLSGRGIQASGSGGRRD